ncbi:hypothetical protein IP70_18615 [alpha proteobacterium AAP38]|uniref:DUF1697 domain-containing protein n=1 Tax=Niveispirillum sp. TaxID=1917217 RepID=UPI0006B9B861|nr:hypothetical protein IP70_18615 [alpha proteobacterium AAP38]
MPTLACLLRGINVGGNKIVKMALWRQLYEEMGFTNVRTLLQSGNLLFDPASDEPLESLQPRLETAFATRFGFTADHIIRDTTQVQAAIANNPFPDAATNAPNHLLVFFLSKAPDAASAAKLAALDTGPDRLHLSSDVLYMHFIHGAGKAATDPVKLLRLAGVTGTSRNWTTLNKLAVLMAG